MFTKMKNKVLGARWIIAACVRVFENRFYAAADDQLCPPAFRYGREDGSLITDGNMTGGAIKNLIDVTTYPFNDSVSAGSKTTLRAYGRTTPQGDAKYAYMPVGSEFIFLTVSGSGDASAVAKYIKTATGANGWSKFGTSITAPSHVIIGAGLAVMVASTIQTITVAAATVGDIVMCQLSTVSGGYPCNSAAIVSAGFITANLASAGTAGATMNYKVVRAITS